MKPLYSIIIPAYNEEKLLPLTLAALQSAMQAQPEKGELIVVDNNSSDATAEIAKSHGARVVFEPVNRIASARNAGARVAEGEFLVFADADTIVPPGLLSAALAGLSSSSVCGGGARVAFDRELPFLVRGFASLWNYCAPRWGYAAGCFVYCRRDAFVETGGFDERVYASEEIGLSIRFRQWGRRHGMKFLVLDESVVSSARKMDWHNSFKMLLTMIFLGLCPFAVRSRRFCYLWYQRP
ncbi:MAG: hypothetical protein A2X49_11990 [Lentisphaerae bacterium GWF2_52_8]|nr:MAG: hypothetical protein A2X49_11990 [Lentisphaerae bacterium GWF2_52_8]